MKDLGLKRKIVGALLLLGAAFSLVACKKKAEEPARIGLLRLIDMSEDDVKKWTSDVAAAEGKQVPYTNPNTLIQFDDLDAMILALKAGTIDRFSLGFLTAQYIVAQDSTLALIDKHHDPILGYSIAMLPSHKDLRDSIDNAISDMKKEGVLDRLMKTYIDEGAKNLSAVKMPSFPDAPVIKVAVTGDLPPMDLVLPNGTPAGFNTAFLAELANRIKVNFALVTMDSGARPLALAQGRIDMLFCFQETFGADGKPFEFSLNNTDNLVLSQPFFMDRRAAVKLAD